MGARALHAVSPAPRYDRDDVLARVDMVELASALGGKPKVKGGKARMPCFLHHGDDKSSFKIDLSSGLWCCFTGCGVDGGTALDLVMRARSLDFPAALVWLGNHVGARPQGPTEHRRYRSRQTRQKAPPRPSVSPHAPVTGVPPCEARLRVLGALWAILEDAPISAEAADYLEHRCPIPDDLHELRDGGAVDIAMALGCRDWSTRAAAIFELLESTTTEDLHASGLASEDGRLWAPLRAIQGHAAPEWHGMARPWGSHRMAGIGVPVWWPGTPAPMAWRWRYLQPLERAGKRALKSQAMFSTADTPPVVLGLHKPPRMQAGPWLPPLTDAPALVIAEGEPDWWSLTQAAAELPAAVRPAVVAVCTAGWRLEWAPLLLRGGKPRPVLVTAHDSGPGDTTARGVAEALVAVGLKPDQWAQRAPFDENLDANDVHRRSGLHGLVRMLGEWTDDT